MNRLLTKSEIEEQKDLHYQIDMIKQMCVDRVESLFEVYYENKPIDEVSFN